MTAAWALTKVQLRIIRNDPWFLVIMSAMSLVIMPLFSRTMGLSLRADGFDGANGAEQVVPGQMVLFGFFVAGSAGFTVFREHGWKTWDRLRASAASSRSLLVGFGVPWVIIHVLWQIAVFLIGGAMVGLRLGGGSPIALVLLMVGYSVVVVSLILLATASFRTVNQLNALQNVGAMVLGGLGGALVPLSQLPDWAQTIAPVTPTYWAMQGHQTVLLEAGGVADIWKHLAVLAGFSIAFCLGASARFRVDETKEFFA